MSEVRIRKYTDATYPEAVHQGLLEASIFALRNCVACQRAHFPPRVLCPFCGSTEFLWIEQSGSGTIYSTSILTPRDRPPYAVVLVDLPEGIRIMSNLASGPAESAEIGARVHVSVGTRDGHAVPLVDVVGP